MNRSFFTPHWIKHAYFYAVGSFKKVSLIVLLSLFCSLAHSNTYYFPEKDNSSWQRKPAKDLGMSESRLKKAVQFAQQAESKRPKDQALASALGFAREPYNDIIGPTTVRAEPTGIILRHGYIAAVWGQPEKVDMTHSISKSFLSSVAAVAYDEGRIVDLDHRISRYINNQHFASEHNKTITWDHMLRQTSAWEGSLWGKPDWADRPVGDDPFEWPSREIPTAGSAWKYNDVRVNAFALALLELIREPLPKVLKKHIMDPIGASDSWRWHGYKNSWIEQDGLRVQSVSGGGHWGGGMFINAYDQARFGYLTLRKGQWENKQIFSNEWYQLATTPTPQNTGYGFMNWFLNTGQEFLPSAPESSITHLGAGTNMVYVDPQNDLVIVARWIQRDAMDELIKRVIESIKE